MATKLTITIPDELAKRLEPHREHLNISRVCAEALEAELKSREVHLASLARYEEFKRMRSEAEAIREHMVAQAGRGWQKLAQDMQRMLKEISREIEQVEKEIPEGLRTEAVTTPETPESAPMAEKLVEIPEPMAEKPAASDEPKPAAARGMHLPQLKPSLKKAPKPVETKPVETKPVEPQPVEPKPAEPEPVATI